MNPRVVAILATVILLVAACSDSSSPEDAAGDDGAPTDASEDSSSEDSAGEDSAGEDSAEATTTTTEPAPLDPTEIPGEPINQYDLAVGDCFDQIEDRRDGQPITITTKLPCADPHHLEVFAKLNYPADHLTPFPGDEAMRDFALRSCYLEFTPWVGRDYETSELEIGVIIPTRENFENSAARYRGVHCWVRHVDGEPMIGTSEGSGW